MTLLFANNAGSTLAVSASVSDTALSLATGEGARFPSLGAGQSFIATLQDGVLYEIVECTARAADTLTVIRAREGTSAQTWGIGTTVTMRATAGTMAALEQRARALAEFAAINGPISLSADPAGPTEAVRESYLAGRETAIRSDLGGDIAARGALVGEVKEYYGLTLPSRYIWAAGQAVSRATYSELFDALTVALTTNVTGGSPTVSVTAGSTDDIVAGMPWSQATYFSTATVVVSKTSNTVTLSTNALGSGTGIAARVCPYGRGDDTTTFNVPDRRGTAAVGRDDMNGSAANRVTTAGSGVNALRVGVLGGSQLLQQHAHGVVDPGHGHGLNDPGHFHGFINGAALTFVPSIGWGTVSGGATTLYYTTQTEVAGTGVSVVANSTGISIQNNGGGGSQNVQPSTICNFVIFTNVP